MHTYIANPLLKSSTNAGGIVARMEAISCVIPSMKAWFEIISLMNSLQLMRLNTLPPLPAVVGMSAHFVRKSDVCI